VRTATRFGLSTFYVGAIVSGFEPENLITGVTASAEHLPQIALGTVIGSAIFMLTGGLGVTLILVPMEVRIPREGGLAMIASLVPFSIAIWNDGTVSRGEGAVLILVAIGLMVWLYRRSPVLFRESDRLNEPAASGHSGVRAPMLLLAGVAVMLVGAEVLVYGVRTLLNGVRLSETFLGMTVVGMGESLEEAARMVVPARRGHSDLAWGNVVGTIVILVGFNLGVIALVRPLAADALVLRFHAPYLIACTVLVATALLRARRLGRSMGLLLIGSYLLYLAINVAHMSA
jgi:cation:H+ antiporter